VEATGRVTIRGCWVFYSELDGLEVDDVLTARIKFGYPGIGKLAELVVSPDGARFRMLIESLTAE
jgi:hypothetical protein